MLPQVAPGTAVAGALSWVDYLIIAVMGLSALVGLTRGLVREVFSLATWAAAVWLGLRFSHDLAVPLETLIPLPSLRLGVAFVAIFLVSLMAGGLTGFLLGRLVTGTGLGGTDRLAGMVFGLTRGVLLVSVMVLLAGFTPLPRDPWWQESRLIPPFQSMALWIKTLLPAEIAGQVAYP
ncbi:membrane protein required for colicin V production [Methylococcus capsulatus]|jgi:membrane protein required for colicin V production|uniref:Membrane protein required for colicin V production n=1 Tax=Methylococcus capsulatus TaxID=414 RepID=A0AA35UVJ7_METCP|nr:CvpA family protein [Methylococcus capsulatus]CAI8828854.1 membrane protein required for colicin V production [Methylococcus capsulatus]